MVKTDPLKYDNCKDCSSRCVHAGKDREFCYHEKSCKKTGVTNADRIRSMNDEELAEWLTYPVCKHADCALKCPVIPENKNFKCVQNILNWLRYPAEED